MTTPTPAPYITGPNIALSVGAPVASLRRDAIQGLVWINFQDYDADWNSLGPRWAVMATSRSDLMVRVATFDTEAEATEYVTTDPDGLLSAAATP